MTSSLAPISCKSLYRLSAIREIKMISPVYGTDMMIGIGTEDVQVRTLRRQLQCERFDKSVPLCSWIVTNESSVVYSARTATLGDWATVAYFITTTVSN